MTFYIMTKNTIHENVFNSFRPIQENYVDTLIYDYFNHDISKGPLKTFDLGEY